LLPLCEHGIATTQRNDSVGFYYSRYRCWAVACSAPNRPAQVAANPKHNGMAAMTIAIISFIGLSSVFLGALLR